MNKIFAPALLSLLLAGCSQGIGSSSTALLVEDIEDIEDYLDWKSDQDEVQVKPFKATPIAVSGTGEVRAAPDIAVITGLIETKADIDHKAVDEAALIMNRVQDIIFGQNVEISFTNLSTAEKRDEDCLDHNLKAQLRHRDISNDNWFNQRQKNRPKDTRQKLREEKTRIAQKVCPVTHIESYIGFTAWVRPSGDVSDYITAFTEAGVEQVNLYGFDFSNYDDLYKQAAEKAVANARQKAELSARIAGTQLTNIEQFSVTRTDRTARYGRQAMIISPHGNRSVTPQQRTSFSDRVIRSQATGRNRSYPVVAPPAMAYNTCPDGSLVASSSHCPVQALSVAETVVVRPASVDYVTIPATYETVSEPVVMQEASTELITIPATFNADGTIRTPARTQERVIPAVTKMQTRRVVKTPASTMERMIPAVTKQVSARDRVKQSNALRETMMSGSKTIRVTANLSYNYETPLDGIIFKTAEK